MKIADTIRRNGFWYTLAILFHRVVPGWLFRCRNFVVYEMCPAPNHTPHGSPGTWLMSPSTNSCATRVRWCDTASDYEAVERLTYFHRSLSDGNLTACSAEVNGRLAGGFWAAAEQFDERELGLRLRLAPTQVWLFAALVPKDMRRRGIHSRMLQFMVSELTSLGFNDILVGVNPSNIGSNRIHSRYARSVAGRVWVVRLLSLTCCITRGRVRSDGWFRFNARRRPIELRFASSATAQPLGETAYGPCDQTLTG